MLNKITERAYAKVNFGLKVFPKREDGFHNIESIFQTINLYDELIVTKTVELGCFVQCDSFELPENNTINNVYRAFCEIIGGLNFGISVELIKRIPSGGGLGGGSSDGAATVRVLEKISKIKLNKNQLDYIASVTGSDVFFFLYCGENGTGCAVVTGRGEVVRKIKPRYDLYLLLIFPNVHSSTKEAYSLVDKMLDSGKEVKTPNLSELETIYYLSPNNWSFKNCFTPAISDVYDDVRFAIDELKKSESCFTEMSGSGSTVYGVFTLKQQAIFVSNLLDDAWNCKVVRTV